MVESIRGNGSSRILYIGGYEFDCCVVKSVNQAEVS